MRSLVRKICVLFVVGLVMAPGFALGQTNTGSPAPTNTGSPAPTNTGSPASNITVNPANGFQLVNPLNVSTICGLMKVILNFILAVGSPVAALFLVWAGFLFIIQRGNPTGLAKARKNLVNVLLGIAIFFAAWLLGQIIANTIKNISPSNAASAGACS